jgi:hypothetical protein
MTMTTFWVALLCSLVEAERRFGGAYCLHNQGDKDAVRASETSVNFYETARRNIPEGCHLEEDLFFSSFPSKIQYTFLIPPTSISCVYEETHCRDLYFIE